jgi:hypothetical protein
MPILLIGVIKFEARRFLWRPKSMPEWCSISLLETRRKPVRPSPTGKRRLLRIEGDRGPVS